MDFFLCFIPLFTAVDAIGNLPIFVGLTEGVPLARLNKIIIQSVITALAVMFIRRDILMMVSQAGLN